MEIKIAAMKVPKYFTEVVTGDNIDGGCALFLHCLSGIF